MDGSAKAVSGGTPVAAQVTYDGPPDYRVVGKHGIFPKLTHDEVERFNFLAQMNRHLAARVLPGVKAAFDTRVEPAFKSEHGRDFKDRHEVRRALAKDPYWRLWSALRRSTMEIRQQAGRWATLRQREELAQRAQALIGDDQGRLVLDPAMPLPRYIAAIDHHCMPGSYHTEYGPSDVANAANYDSGLFATTGGMLGRYNDGGGQAVVQWVKANLPDFKPKRILDIGCGLGHNAVPIAQAFPDAEVVAVDVGAPMLRYGLARAKSLGVNNIRFVQANVESLPQFADGGFDWVQSTMFLHETSYASMKRIFAESFRLLAPGGFVLHVEQPQYAPTMPLFEQAMRDWDAFYNAEPFWTKMHEVDLDAWMAEAGFPAETILHGGVMAVVDTTLFPDVAQEKGEDYGRKAAWHVVGARKEVV
ncbi:class I SAM-dependent methyltransferase [Nitrospirillum sp. BR 11752]|uniref:class I SAM-dependent methyltransferase n=1 Tax=Nitrospirillum sp. BR 11752 TaxID=3104293 RepID=UPI002EA047DD|nr:class I SAM-dependent methyltransferase [Nitrospirillum sp. BR 11752]